MAYNAVAQADHDTDSLDGRSDVSDSSNAHPGHTASANGHGPLDSVLHVIRSRNKSTTSDEYEMVEADDYENPDPVSPVRMHHPLPQHRAETPQREDQYRGSSVAEGSTQRRSPSPEPLMRSSTSSGVALSHPTPDLQSLQGAYVGNVERLEEFAERMSRTSSDLGRELRKLDQEQKRRASVTSSPTSPRPPRSASSINAVARSGGYASNSANMVSSPRSSVFSNSRLRSTSVSEPLEEIPLDDSNNDDPASQRPSQSDGPSAGAPIAEPQNRQSFLPEVQSVGGFESEMFDRPMTSHSTDTYRQATNLFRDFDGVHFVPHSRSSSHSRQMSLSKPPLAENAEHFDQPQAGQDLVYYPAPIPKVLNLPQRLSKRPPISEQNKRRTQLLETLIGKSNDSKADGDNRKSKRLSALPPQLRASVFFDQGRSPLDVQIKDRSAVSTLESVLDESVNAPVTAFIDHPIAGKVGREVYRKSGKPRRLEKKKRGDDAGQRNSDVDVADNMPLHPGHGRNNESEGSTTDDSASTGSTGSETETSEASDEEFEEPVFTGRPATLIAELEMRKQEQKMRNRTAGTAGMHSTLLELDAVAQAQHNARRQKHVTLAWEAEADENQDGEDDEDVPLGVLYRSKHPALVDQRPLGLMERRELEENEPLSRRRARLRGEPLPPAPAKRASTMNLARSSTMMGASGDVPAENNGNTESEDEHETLAQRRHRLKGHKHMESVVSAEFETEIMAEIKKLQEPDEPKPAEQPKKAEPKKTEPKAAPAPAVTDDDEEGETLAQRRKRLLAQRPQTQHQQQPSQHFLDGYANDTNRMRHSMANILQSYPTSHAAPSTMDSFADRRGPAGKSVPRMTSMYTLPPSMMQYAQYSQIQLPAYNVPQHRPMQPTMDERQREFINRWRESVLR